jgi:hypothetical protein
MVVPVPENAAAFKRAPAGERWQGAVPKGPEFSNEIPGMVVFKKRGMASSVQPLPPGMKGRGRRTKPTSSEPTEGEMQEQSPQETNTVSTPKAEESGKESSSSLDSQAGRESTVEKRSDEPAAEKNTNGDAKSKQQHVKIMTTDERVGAASRQPGQPFSASEFSSATSRTFSESVRDPESKKEWLESLRARRAGSLTTG